MSRSCRHASRERRLRDVLRAIIGVRGASTIEYGIILVAVMLVAAGSYKLLGGSVNKGGGAAGDSITNNEADGPNRKKGQADDGANGGKGGNGNGSASSKMKVGGGGGGGANDDSPQQVAGRNRDTSSDQGPNKPVGPISNEKYTGGPDVADNFQAKRWMGYGLLTAGLIAIAYVGMSMRRAKQGGNAVAGDGKSGGGAPRKRAI